MAATDPASAASMTGAESALRTAYRAGVRMCFANPGTTEMGFVSALERVPEVRTVLGLFEGVCTGMADGYARMTGTPAITLLHLGVGLGNGIANLHNARRAQSAVLNIVGDHPASHIPYDAPLTSDIASMAKPVSDWIRTTDSPEGLGRDTAEALAHIWGPPGRIATLIAPADCLRDPVSSVHDPAPAPVPGAVDERGVSQAVEALRSGDPCALLVSGHGLHEKGLRTARRIVNATACRLLCDSFPARLDRGAGVPEVERLPYFPELVLDRLKDVRYLILAGAREPVSFFKYPDYPSRLVPDGCEVLTLAAHVVNPVPALDALAEALNAPAATPDRSPAARPGAPNGDISTKTVGAAIAATLPDSAIIADESATSGGSTYYLTMKCPPHSAMYLTGGGIGWGLPAATGAALGCPDRPVLALQGDGGGMYTLQALWTQAREGLNVTNVIFSNRKYQILQVEQGRAGVDEPGPISGALTELTDPEIDWVSLAKGMGVPATRPETAEALFNDLERAYAESGPHLIDVVL